jgi:hypothetical protein
LMIKMSVNHGVARLSLKCAGTPRVITGLAVPVQRGNKGLPMRAACGIIPL